jgi:RHS repeat-associated protein
MKPTENFPTFNPPNLNQKAMPKARPQPSVTVSLRMYLLVVTAVGKSFVYEDSKLAFIQTPEGRIVPDHDTYAYEYFLKDHLGNTRVVFNEQGEMLQIEAKWRSRLFGNNSYYPFGGIMEGLNYTAGLAPENKYLYNGKEFQDDFGIDWHDYGARFYDAQLGRWHVTDPMAEVAYDWSPYRYGYNNPIKFSDPTGMLESTHTDEDGKVIAVYDDGDNGVYKHEGNGDKAAKTVEKNYSEDNTSAGGEEMGESLHSLSFADQSLYNETGEVKPTDIKIDFGSTELTDKVQGIIDAAPSLIEYASKAGTNGDWDLKSNTSNGSKLYGKYASPRDAGNFTAGAIAQMSGVAPIAQFGFGAYNMTGNSKLLTGLVTGAVGGLTLINRAAGLGAAHLIGKYGEDKLSQRSIDIGKQYIKNK